MGKRDLHAAAQLAAIYLSQAKATEHPWGWKVSRMWGPRKQGRVMELPWVKEQ